MPYDWVAPDIAFKYRGITIYCTYKADQYQNPPRTYLFVLNELHHEDDAFDIRDWPCYNPDRTVARNVERAIDLGAITPTGVTW